MNDGTHCGLGVSRLGLSLSRLPLVLRASEVLEIPRVRRVFILRLPLAACSNGWLSRSSTLALPH